MARKKAEGGSKSTRSTPRKKAAAPAAERGPVPSRKGVLERGDLFFLYRPDVGDDAPGGLVDVQRFHLVLRPEGGERIRLITVGRKMLPGAEAGDARHWGFVDRVFDDAEALRAELGGSADGGGLGRQMPVRPAGEGVYALAKSGRDTVLAYALELPEEPGEVQRAFGIDREGRFLNSLKNPEGGSPDGAGLDSDRRAEFPEELQARFGSRRWLPVDPPDFLDYEGAEILLIAGRAGDAPGDDDQDMGLEPQPEDHDSSELVEALRLEAGRREAAPLFEGTWA